MSALPVAAARDPAVAQRQALGFSSDPDLPRYALGGVVFSAPRDLPLLSGFATTTNCNRPDTPGLADGRAWRTAISAHVIDRTRRVNAVCDSDRTLLEIEGLGHHAVSHRGEISSCQPIDLQQWSQLLCGPLLPLALARFGHFQLHASACVINGRMLLLAGLSGAGKSTLSQQLQQRGHASIADDVVTFSDQAPRIAGPFPQPKWPSWGAAVGKRLPNGHLGKPPCVVMLRPGSEDQPALRLLNASAATLALARHSVATRLFEPALLGRHLDWCARLAPQLQVLELCYRQNPDEIRPMVALLESLFDHD